MISNKTITFGDISFCPYCKQETLFKYGNREGHRYVVKCHGNKTKWGCGFTWVAPYNENDYSAAMKLFEKGVLDFSELEEGTLLPVVAVGDLMSPPLRDRDTYILEIGAFEGSDFIDDEIYSVVFVEYPEMGNLSYVTRRNNGYVLYNNNRDDEMWVKKDSIYIVGRLLGYKEKPENTSRITWGIIQDN